jgi:hypothetical protein
MILHLIALASKLQGHAETQQISVISGDKHVKLGAQAVVSLFPKFVVRGVICNVEEQF